MFASYLVANPEDRFYRDEAHDNAADDATDWKVDLQVMRTLINPYLHQGNLDPCKPC